MRYFWITLKHKWFVLLASFKIGLPLWRAIVHDLSKFTLAELPHYARQFFGDKGDPAGFAVAWLHHQNCNPHHWEYWITRSDHSHGGSKAENGCLPMPSIYVKEMVTDWLGASMAYQGHWNIQNWLNENGPKMHLHSKTLALMETELSRLGYVLTDNCPWSYLKFGKNL